MLSATSNHIDDSRSILATSIDGVKQSQVFCFISSLPQNAIFEVNKEVSLMGNLPNNNALLEVVKAPAPLAIVNQILNNKNMFLADSDDEDEEDDNAAGPVPIADTIVTEVRNYHAKTSQLMHVVGENSSLFSDPLVWWKAHVA